MPTLEPTPTATPTPLPAPTPTATYTPTAAPTATPTGAEGYLPSQVPPPPDPPVPVAEGFALFSFTLENDEESWFYVTRVVNESGGRTPLVEFESKEEASEFAQKVSTWYESEAGGNHERSPERDFMGWITLRPPDWFSIENDYEIVLSVWSDDVNLSITRKLHWGSPEGQPTCDPFPPVAVPSGCILYRYEISDHMTWSDSEGRNEFDLFPWHIWHFECRDETTMLEFYETSHLIMPSVLGIPCEILGGKDKSFEIRCPPTRWP